MKSTTIKISHNTGVDVGNYKKFKVKMLEAYAIEYSYVDFGGISLNEDYFYIEQDEVFIDKGTLEVMAADIYLYVYYHGIRDYRLLFHGVSNEGLAKRLGAFYEEAERNFEIGSWLSYTLMCGAIFEGMLYAKQNKDAGFDDLIKDALKEGDIDNKTAKIMHFTRRSRNIVHANNYRRDYISRKDAMDIRTTMDKLIKEFKY